MAVDLVACFSPFRSMEPFIDSTPEPFTQPGDTLIAGRPIRYGHHVLQLIGADPWHIEPVVSLPPSQTLFYIDGDPNNQTVKDRYRIQTNYTDGPCSSFEDLQAWVMQNWQHPIGSLEAAVHVYHKFSEEVEELLLALESGDLVEIRSEIGDVCWTATAMALGEGVQFSGMVDNNEQEIMAGKAHHFARTYFAKALERNSMQELLYECAGVYQKRVRKHRALTKRIYRLEDTSASIRPIPTAFEERCILSDLSDLLLLLSLLAEKVDCNLLDCAELTRVKLEARIAANNPITKPASPR